MKAWEGRFSKKTDKTVEEFTASLPFDKRLYKQDIRGSIAHTAMLARTEILQLEESDLIIDALQEIYAEIEEGRFHFDPADEDI
ncbi:MAG TPA: lyase family protein, partial [Candidatus Subteraquimicrobiales bacterium]